MARNTLGYFQWGKTAPVHHSITYTQENKVRQIIVPAGVLWLGSLGLEVLVCYLALLDCQLQCVHMPDKSLIAMSSFWSPFLLVIS